MNTTAHHPPAAQTPSTVGHALTGLAYTAWHLLTATLQGLRRTGTGTAPSGKRLRAQGADARAQANRWARTDHRMAADIYCAADRDELGEQ